MLPLTSQAIITPSIDRVLPVVLAYDVEMASPDTYAVSLLLQVINNKPDVVQNLMFIMKDLACSDPYFKTHLSTLLNATCNGITGLYWGMMERYTNVVSNYIAGIEDFYTAELLDRQQTFSLLQSRTVDGIPLLHFLMENSNPEDITGYFNILKQFFFNGCFRSEEIINILHAKNKENYTCLDAIMDTGNACNISEYLTRLQDLYYSGILERKQIVELLQEEKPRKFPGILLSMLNNNESALSVYIDELGKMAQCGILTSDEITTILLAKNCYAHSSLFLAMYYKGATTSTMTTYFTSLSDLKSKGLISSSQLITLLKATSAGGITTLFQSIESGCIKKINSIISGIKILSRHLNEDQLAMLMKGECDNRYTFSLDDEDAGILTPDSPRVPPGYEYGDSLDEILHPASEYRYSALCYAMVNDMSSVTKFFIDKTISMYDADKLNSAHVREILMAKDNLGNPGLNIAMQRGNNSVIDSYCNHLRHLNNKRELLLPLLQAQDTQGIPALFKAVESKQIEGIKTFLYAIGRLARGHQRSDEQKLTSEEVVTLFRGPADCTYSAILKARELQDRHIITAFKTSIQRLYSDRCLNLIDALSLAQDLQ